MNVAKQYIPSKSYGNYSMHVIDYLTLFFTLNHNIPFASLTPMIWWCLMIQMSVLLPDDWRFSSSKVLEIPRKFTGSSWTSKPELQNQLILSVLSMFQTQWYVYTQRKPLILSVKVSLIPVLKLFSGSARRAIEFLIVGWCHFAIH